jgi:photosystem II stability/assembly factor-like uncharacterized protein
MGSTVVAVGTRKGLWLARSEDRQDWSVEGPQFLMREVPSLGFVSRGGGVRLLAGVRSEHWGPTVMHSDDLGSTWVERPDGAAISFPEDTGVALSRIWQITADPHDPEVVWAGTEPHALWRSTDGGTSFDLVRGLWDHPHRPLWGEGFGGGAIHTVLPDPQDPSRMLVAMSTGGVYTTVDGGATWEASNKGIEARYVPDPFPEFGQCVHKVARDPADVRRLYLQCHHGVYRSDDSGAGWQSIASGLPTDFGFTVLTHPRRGGSLWLVPVVADGERIPPGAQLQLQHSTDAGDTWQTQAQGLPHPSYTCVLRDAAAVDTHEQAGLYVGTRNGDVFASADEGATFARILEQLPDVLCVRVAVLP